MKKIGRITAVAAAVAAVLTMTAAAAPTRALAAESYVSELAVASGKDAVGKLEADGFSVIYQNFNLSPDAKEDVYVGYKLGGTPITGIAADFGCSDSITANGAEYRLVSNINLNAGTDGPAVYLYCTRDTQAGTGITALSTISRDRINSDEICPLAGDGSEPVRFVNGEPADFEEGVSGSELYVTMIRDELCRPYIKSIRTATGIDRTDALFDAVRQGCYYFTDEPISTVDGMVTYLCYERTADSSEALTGVAASYDPYKLSVGGVAYDKAGDVADDETPYYLYTTRDETVGNPLTDITAGRWMGDEFTLGDWASSYFVSPRSSAMAQIRTEPLYAELIEDEEPYTQLDVVLYDGGKAAMTTPLVVVEAADMPEAAAEPAQVVSALPPMIEEEQDDEVFVAQPDASDEQLVGVQPGGERDELNPLAEEKPIYDNDEPVPGEYDDIFAAPASDSDVSFSDVSDTDVSGTDVSGSDLVGSVFGAGWIAAIAAVVLLAAFGVFMALRGKRGSTEAAGTDNSSDAERTSDETEGEKDD